MNRLLNIQNKLYKHALILTKNEFNAKDLLQDTNERVIRKLDLYHGKVKFETWACVIMHNIFIDSLRNKKRQVIDVRDYYSEEGESIKNNYLNIVKRIKNQDIKEAILLRSLGFKQIEIAERKGVSINTISGRIRYARKNIKSCIF